MRPFDAHTHVFAPGQAKAREQLGARDRTFREMYASPNAAMATGADLLQTLEESAFQGALAAGFAFANERDLAEQTEHLLHLAQGAPHVFAAVPTNPALPGWEIALRHARQSGAVAVGELRPHSQGWDPLGPDGHRLCLLAGELGIALLWHVSEPVGHAYAGKRGGISPAELITLSSAHPAVPMIGAHLGGGAAFYLQMPEVREKTPSLYFDTAAAFLLYDDQCVQRLADLVGPARILFASDYPLLPPRRELERVRATLPGAVAEAVCGGNALTLFSELRTK